MAYRLRRRDDSVDEGLRRIADEQIGKALAALHGPDPAEAIHEVRTRCKKLRALIRLVRPAFADYRLENAALRDIARAIGGARDAKVMQDTYDALMNEFSGQVERRAMGSIRRRFTLERAAREGAGDLGAAIAETAERLVAARDRAASCQLDEDGWEAVAGLRQTYSHARRAAAQVRACPSDPAFHELRKQIKYHWFHCRLLRGVWPEMMGLRQDCARRLGELLGEHHDLAVFAGRLAGDPHAFGSPPEVEAAVGLARGRQQHLAGEAAPLLHLLLAQRPKAFVEHIEALWHLWREER